MPDNESFLTIQPQIQSIRKYISYYYFHTSSDIKFKKSFTFFPNYKHGITAYYGSKNDFRDCSNVEPSIDTITVLYTMNYDQAIQVHLKGAFNKIGIAFRTCGINHFMKDDLKKHYNNDNHLFNYFGEEFKKLLISVYNTSNIEKKRDLLDSFFEKKHVIFQEENLMGIVQEIIESNGTVKIEELSKKYNIHRKTILRLFQKHFCCSPETYKKMVKFRNTLNYTQTQNQFDSLTEISLFNHYYDQADFNKQFKAITNFTPKELLSKIKKIGNEDIYWIVD
ncbi:MAG: helix-turn-helix transcriptional regulator [Flavobacteriia bacterium]|nr:helix-turn-helix transcriptional regulator [Flavobacteriia bacterium]